MPDKRDTPKALKSKGLQTEGRIFERGQTKRRRVRYACKPELQRMFDVVNLIPADHRMDTDSYMRDRKLFLKPGSTGWIDQERRKHDAFQEYLKSFPKEFQAYMFFSNSD